MKAKLLQEIKKGFNNIKFTEKEKTTVRYHSDERTEILSFNFYPDKVDQTYNKMSKTLEELVPYKNGEIIVHEAVNSKIFDQQQEVFLIKRSKIYEIYLYDLEAFSYIRLIHEQDPKGREWISLDIDYVKNCLWFKD